ncbi:MAG: hypothetical protein ABI697_13220 [Devosia sp.]
MRSAVAAGLLIVSVLASSASLASMTDKVRAAFVNRCETSMYMSAAQCGCMADIADKSLDDLAIAYLSLDPLDVTHSAAYSKQMTSKELASIDGFMKTAPHKCEGAM